MNLYDHICSFENIYLAYRKARRGKRASVSTADFEYNQEEELLRLRAELSAQTWQPGPYRTFYIHDPKKRLIAAAPFRDRVVHHALCNWIAPLWEPLFIRDSYANRIEKGTHRAILRASHFARRYRYVLQCDFVQFFPSLSHQILLHELQSVLRDPATLWLCRQILNAPHPQEEARGLPIGNLTSQFWANVYLNPFDHFVRRELRCPAYLRYVDDFLLFSNEKAILHQWKEAILHRIARLRLSLHPPQVFPVSNGIPFLGFRIYPDHRRLKRKRGIAFQRRFGWLYRRWRRGEICRSRLDSTARSWAAHAAWGDTYALRRAVLGRHVLYAETATG